MSVEQVFDAASTLRQLRAAPLGPHLQGYCDWMRERGYSRRQSLRRFLDWLGTEATSAGLARLTAPRIEQFFLDCASSLGRAGRRSLQATLRTFLRFCWQRRRKTNCRIILNPAVE